MSKCNKKKVKDCEKNKVMKYCNSETGECVKRNPEKKRKRTRA